jgi:hypothetical protein
MSESVPETEGQALLVGCHKKTDGPMSAARAGVLFHRVRRLLDARRADSPDHELLSRFAAYRDEAAFSTLMDRYGPLVFGICRRALQHQQDAEDAFQATFLILARRASAIRKRSSLGSWLYGVAHRVALKARSNRDCRERPDFHRSSFAAESLHQFFGSLLTPR